MEFLAEAPIQVVTVYSDQAQVLRHAGVRVAEAGIHTIRIGGLPQTLQRNSLRATGQGPSGTRILGIEQETEIHASAPSEDIGGSLKRSPDCVAKSRASNRARRSPRNSAIGCAPLESRPPAGWPMA